MPAIQSMLNLKPLPEPCRWRLCCQRARVLRVQVKIGECKVSSDAYPARKQRIVRLGKDATCNISVAPAPTDPFSTLTRDAYLPPAPLVPLDEPVLLEPDPEPGGVRSVDILRVPVFKSGSSIGPPRIIAPLDWLSGSSCTRMRDGA